MTFVIDIREAQSLLKLMRMLDDMTRVRGRNIDTGGLNDGNKQDFRAVRSELENMLLMKDKI